MTPAPDDTAASTAGAHVSSGAVTRRAAAIAHPNIALIKYWGKRDRSLNLPAAGSLSVTLDGLETRTEVHFDPSLSADELQLGSVAQPERVSRFLDLIRVRAGTDLRARVTTANNFPTGAGLASSAAGFAALAVAGTEALGLGLTRTELSALARQGSGSAARSLFGGFAVMEPGIAPDGSDAAARQLLAGDRWPLAVVIAITSTDAKTVPSTAGMEASRHTSPYYEAWLTQVTADLASAAAAVRSRNFRALAEVSEASCLAMHGMMLATRPGLLYWNGATVDCLHRIRELRDRDGHDVFFTVDAGPQVKAVCAPGDAAAVAGALRELPGVRDVLTVGLGEGARPVAAESGAEPAGPPTMPTRSAAMPSSGSLPRSG